MPTMPSLPKGISLPSPEKLKSAFKKLMEVELLGSGEASASGGGGTTRPGGGSPARTRRASQEESELSDLSWRRFGGGERYTERPEGGYVQEGELVDGKQKRRNEVAERLQEIADRMHQEEQDRLHADERRQQLHSELAGAAKRRGTQGAACACTGVCDCGQEHGDNASTTLSSGETEEGLEASQSRDWEREQRQLVEIHTVKFGDTAASICVQWNVSLAQLLQANRAFSAHSLLLRKEIKIPMMTQMDPY